LKKKLSVAALLCLFALSIIILYFPKVQAQEIGLGPSRLSGQSRYQTARDISEDFNNSKCDNVILAYGNDFPDALSASVLSKKFNAPILLVDSKVNEKY